MTRRIVDKRLMLMEDIVWSGNLFDLNTRHRRALVCRLDAACEAGDVTAMGGDDIAR